MRNGALVLLLGALTCSAACDHRAPAAASAVPNTDSGGSAAGSMAAAQSQVSVTLVDVTAGSTGTSNNYVGQSVTIPGHGTFDRLRFNWYTFTGSPTAFGSLLLLDREYLGTPQDLGPSTPGFIAQSQSIADGQYVFDPKVKVKAGSKCWFYTNTTGAFVTGFSSDTYAGGDMYITGMPALPFRLEPATGAPPGTYIDANFRLQSR